MDKNVKIKHTLIHISVSWAGARRTSPDTKNNILQNLHHADNYTDRDHNRSVQGYN